MWYTLGDYTLDTQRYELCRAGSPLPLQPKVFELLVYLIQHRDRVVTRQELFDTLWPEQFVSDDALEWLMAAARRAVGDSGRAQRVIKTIRSRGYRCIAAVEEHPQPRPEAARLPAPVLDAEESPTVSPAMGGERKQVTVLACGLSAVVTQAEGLEPETLHTMRQRFFALAQQAVQRYAGTIQHFVDNTCLAFFGAPMAQEDHARRAVLAALRLQACLRHPDTALASGTERERAVCISVHTGEVIVGSIGTDPRQIALAVGDTTQMAELLLRSAEPGAIVLSAAAGQLVQDFVRLDLMTPVNVPGVTASHTVYKVLGLSSYHPAQGWQGRRVVRQFVGREREMGTLHALLAQVENGHGQVVGIAGEPGIGKSRFLYEFRQQMRRTPRTYLAGRCVSYGQATPYLPLLDLLHQACGLTERDISDATATKIGQYLQDIGMEPEAWRPYVLRVLGREDSTEHLPSLSPQALRTRIFESLIQMQLHASRRQPLCLEVEDVHWIDPTSEEWLVALIERLAGVPILLLLSYRSGYQPTWMGKSYATQLALQRLTVAESRRIVRAMLPPQLDHLVPAIVAKGQGNPFFLEELAQAIVEQGAQQATLVMPETVQAVLAARLDRLPPEAKALLQVAAVIGGEVPGALLQAVTALSEATLRQHLASLQEAELFYEARSVPEPVYVFKHTLTQEVAYHSLLRETRQQYHRQIAEVLVERFATMVETQSEVMAHHYTEAGRIEQAIPYWQRAGERAAARSAHHEAVMHCTRGLAVLQKLPETLERARRELGLQVILGSSLSAIRGPTALQVGAAYSRARELSENLEDTTQLSRALTGLFPFHGARGEFQVALEIAEQHLRLAQRQNDFIPRFLAHAQMGFALFFRGELGPARTNFERAMALYDPQQHGDLAILLLMDCVVWGLCYFAWSLAILGYSDQAVTRIHEALTRAQELAHPYSLMYARMHAVIVHHLRLDIQAVQEHAEAMVVICEEQEFVFWSGWGLFYQGWALVAQGQGEEGVAQMHQGIARFAHAPLMGPYARALLTEACTHIGQTEEGWEVLTEALNEMEQGEGRFYTAELYRLKGDLLLRQAITNAPQVEACFQQALDLARHAQAKWWELRAATSLARLWQSQDKHQDAYDLLAPVYGWFTEGFDTPDLQDAQALLRQLSSTP